MLDVEIISKCFHAFRLSEGQLILTDYFAESYLTLSATKDLRSIVYFKALQKTVFERIVQSSRSAVQLPLNCTIAHQQRCYKMMLNISTDDFISAILLPFFIPQENCNMKSRSVQKHSFFAIASANHYKYSAYLSGFYKLHSCTIVFSRDRIR